MTEAVQNRAKRETDSRAAVERPRKWMPPQLLPDPHPEEGYAFRWIRLSTLGAADAMNISSKLREGWEPVKVDRRLQDGESINLGEVTLTPTWAPGHSPGCTTWSMDTQDSGEILRVVFFGCNGPNDGVQLINNPRFPTLVEDALFGFDNMAKLQADIYLTGHPQAPFEGIEHLMRVQVRPHPLLNQQPWAEFIAARKQDFEARVQAEQD